tara:strand:- start:70 stop:417 length:348 start_codon:yes stop_codon:yes gene_type:complete
MRVALFSHWGCFVLYFPFAHTPLICEAHVHTIVHTCSHVCSRLLWLFVVLPSQHTLCCFPNHWQTAQTKNTQKNQATMSCMGLDFGYQTAVIAVPKGGGIEVVLNDYSKRATPYV